MTAIVPPYLVPGDKVALIAPAGKVIPEQIEHAINIITSWRLKVVQGENLYSQNGYFAGTDEQRLHDLQQMINDKDVKAIFCMRGGYGITRIIDLIDLSPLLQDPKWIIGFSDITALHLKMAKYNIESVHGIMPVNFDPEKAGASIENLKNFLFGQQNLLQWDSHPNNNMGKAKGVLKGGNLSILADSMGTESALEGANTILFIEEVDEYLYKIDRMLIQLKRNGIFKSLKGLIIGHFSSVKDTKTPFGNTLEKIILEKVEDLSIPVAFGFPAGHDYPNYALPHNRVIELEVNNDISILKF